MSEVDQNPPESARFAHVRALDGLRGVAVVLVVLFHFVPKRVPGGFLGVDVFFVLSGFLITSLAIGEHRSTGSVSAPAFFARRARRLLPAAVTTIIVSVVLVMVLDPEAYRGTLRGQAVASLLYVNNWWAIAQHDTYGALFGAESPLTQFWSLSIEEQFYIVFPFVLLAVGAVVRARRATTRSFVVALLAIASVGAVASAVRMSTLYEPLADPSRLYYGTDTRLQSVLIGVAAGCALWLWRSGGARRAPAWLCTAFAALGTAVLLATALRGGFLQSWLYRWGFFALALVAAAVVLAVNVHRGLVARVFETRVLVVLGLYSYGIYLWHWPVAVFLDASRTGLDGWTLFLVRVAVTGAAAAVSYLLVERPFRSVRTGEESRRLVSALRAPRGAVVAVAGVLVAVAAVWIIARPVAAGGQLSVTSPQRIDSTDPGRPLKVMWTGDSVAWTLGGGWISFPQSTSYAQVFDPTKVALWNLGTYPCPLLDVPSRSMGVVRTNLSKCLDRSTAWTAAIGEFSPDVVVWSGELFDTNDIYVDGRWIAFGSTEWDESYLAALEEARLAATSSGATFVLVGQVDPAPSRDELNNEALLPANVWRFAHLRELEHRFAERHPDDTRMIDLQQLMCPTEPCPTVSDAGVVLRPDGIHYSVDSARVMAPIITEALFEALGRARN